MEAEKLTTPRRRIRAKLLLRRYLPLSGVLVYELLTLRNVYVYLAALALRPSGEHFFAYEVLQSRLNFWIRIPESIFPVFESFFLKRVLGSASSLQPGIFFYSFWEIAVLDLFLGPLVWLLVLALLGRGLTRFFPE